MKINLVPQNFIPPEPNANDLVFGEANQYGKSLSGTVLREDGQWTDYLPEDETQIRKIETSNCTGYNTNAAKEVLMEEQFNIVEDSSDRFLGILAGTWPPGNSPNKVAQAARTNGFIPEPDLPFTDDISSVDEYYSPKPLPKVLLDKGQAWRSKYDFGYDWVANGSNATPEKMMEALKYSPLGVAVYAWAEDNGKYVRLGEDIHWTLIVGYKINEYWICRDSYSPFEKRLAWNFGFKYVMRYSIEKKPTTQELNILQQIINALAKAIGLQAVWVKRIVDEKSEEKSVEAVAESNVIPVVEEPDLIREMALAICTYENAPASWNNPGAIRGLNGQFLKFTTRDEGFAYLIDYITRACTGKHKAYKPEFTLLRFFEIYSPASDGNFPHTYAQFVANRIGLSTDTLIRTLVKKA